MIYGIQNTQEHGTWPAAGEAGASGRPGGELGRDAFLQLLVTQLRYQDPINPLDGRDMVAQLAQFAALERLSEVADGFARLEAALEEVGSADARQQALALLGRTVRLAGGAGGIVAALTLVDGAPVLSLEDGTTFRLEDVVEVLREVPVP